MTGTWSCRLGSDIVKARHISPEIVISQQQTLRFIIIVLLMWYVTYWHFHLLFKTKHKASFYFLTKYNSSFQLYGCDVWNTRSSGQRYIFITFLFLSSDYRWHKIQWSAVTPSSGCSPHASPCLRVHCAGFVDGLFPQRRWERPGFRDHVIIAYTFRYAWFKFSFLSSISVAWKIH